MPDQQEQHKIYIISAEIFGHCWQSRVTAPTAPAAIAAAFGVTHFSGLHDKENDFFDATSLQGGCGMQAKARPLVSAVIDNVNFKQQNKGK